MNSFRKPIPAHERKRINRSRSNPKAAKGIDRDVWLEYMAADEEDFNLPPGEVVYYPWSEQDALTKYRKLAYEGV